MTKTEKVEKRILWLSFAAGVATVIAEFVMAIYTGSQSVLMDAAYDSSELIIIGLTLFLTPLFHKPISEKRPFGYAQLESVLIIIKCFMILAVTIGLTINSIEIILSGGNRVNTSQIGIFQVGMGCVGIVILIFMQMMNKKISSPIADIEIYDWKLDIVYSWGMAIAFTAATLIEKTSFAWMSAYFDQVMAIIVVFAMMPEVIRMLVKSFKDVFLFSPEDEVMDEIKEKSEPIMEKYGFETEFFDVTRTGRRIWISVYFSTEEKYVSIDEINMATREIKKEMNEIFEHCECELVINTD